MKLLPYILTVVIIQFFLFYLIPKLKNKTQSMELISQQKRMVYLKKSLFMFFTICCVIMTLLAFLLFVFSNEISKSNEFNFYFISAPMLLLSFVFDILIYSINRKVLYFEDFFVYVHFFRKRRIYYKEITSIERNKNKNLVIRTKNHKIVLYNVMIGLDTFENIVKEKIADNKI